MKINKQSWHFRLIQWVLNAEKDNKETELPKDLCGYYAILFKICLNTCFLIFLIGMALRGLYLGYRFGTFLPSEKDFNSLPIFDWLSFCMAFLWAIGLAIVSFSILVDKTKSKLCKPIEYV